MAQEKSHRPFQVEDLFRLEQLGRSNTFLGLTPTAFSPNGKKLAYVWVRPKQMALTYNLPRLEGNNRAEVWVVSTKSGEPQAITKGASDRAGFWGPQWSSDSQYLSLLSNKDNNIHLYIWNSETEQLQQVSERGLALRQSKPIWISSTEIIYPVLPKGEKPLSTSAQTQTPRVAPKSWQKMQKGVEPTASVLTSGMPVDISSRPQGQFILYNTRTDEEKVLFDGDVRGLTPSSDGKLIAGFVPVGVSRPQAGQPLPPYGKGATRYQVRVFNHQEMLSPGKLKTVEHANAFPKSSLRWAPDGSKFAFAGGAFDYSGETPAHIYIFTPSTGKLDRMELTNLNLVVPPAQSKTLPPLSPKFHWSADNQLAVYAKKQDGKRADWWIVGKSDTVRNLTKALPKAPRQIYQISGEKAWIGIIGGDVWKFSTGGSKPINLTSNLQTRVVRFAELDKRQAMKKGVREVLVQAINRKRGSSFYKLSLTDEGVLQHIQKPSSEAELKTFSHNTNATVFYLSDRTGSYLWLTQSDSEDSRLLVEENQFLQNIAKAESRLIEYVSLDGESLSAWLLLPVGYEEGQRYPLVTFVYAGSMVNPNRLMPLANIYNSSALNLQILTARGYAVLLPSMPLAQPPGQPGNPYMELTDGVLPAVKKAIELGIADPNALAVMGQSYGGYNTYGLTTQTDYFDAAIALAGMSNLISVYGQFDARMRYSDFMEDGHFIMLWSELGQARMGGPPWEQTQRYVRNSPITYVERVNTPLLIIHGDQDFVPIQQAEEFYTALYRQGKPAKFVRYWGEGHVLSSPANIKHMWQQIFGWLDKYLKSKPDTSHKTVKQSN